MKSDRLPAAPPGLSPRARRLWAALMGAWKFQPDELEVARLAVEAVSRADLAQQKLEEDGLVLADSRGKSYAHPAAGIREAAETSAARLLRQLGLSKESPQASRAAAALARKRWSA